MLSQKTERAVLCRCLLLFGAALLCCALSSMLRDAYFTLRTAARQDNAALTQNILQEIANAADLACMTSLSALDGLYEESYLGVQAYAREYDRITKLRKWSRTIKLEKIHTQVEVVEALRTANGYKVNAVYTTRCILQDGRISSLELSSCRRLELKRIREGYIIKSDEYLIHPAGKINKIYDKAIGE